MEHVIMYDKSPSDWREALPLGNGVFGGMGFFKENKLTLALNHYEVYYKIFNKYSETYKENCNKKYPKGTTYEELEKIAKEHYTDYKKEPVYSYFETLFGYSAGYGHSLGGESQMGAGIVEIEMGEKLEDPDDYQLKLNIEKALLNLYVKKEKQEVTIETLVAQDKDILVTEVTQSEKQLVKCIKLQYPKRRYQTDFECKFKKIDESSFGCEVSFYPSGEDRNTYPPFEFITLIKLVGATGEIKLENLTEGFINITNSEKNFTILTSVLTKYKGDHLAQQCSEQLIWAKDNIETLKTNHQNKWKEFFSKSQITIPDKFLEKLWYMNLYTLGCCSGKEGVMASEACGLSGLWDIKQPTIWGSMWYWDVNIQAAFSPVYTANHEELAEVFSNGFLSYMNNAQKMAENFYEKPGYAMDYPHKLYNCIMPWTAQYLWWHYKYFGDENFLREKAFPVFEGILRFIENIIKWDEKKQVYYFYPDISPEQGPLTRNSTITVSTVKYLLEIAIETTQILNIDTQAVATWKNILSKLPSYPIEENGKYGVTIKDSEYAPADLALRHPSLLMPIYPIGEINQYSEAAIKDIAINTLRYVEENSEIGVFIFGWIACAAARMGKGNTALRVLYEKGIDFMLHSNGMWSEETERWNNYCNTGKGYLYFPFMMEPVGEIVAAINEMLIQSYDGVINIFPAIPNGEKEPERFAGKYYHGIRNIEKEYSAWQDIEFRRLRAVGGAEVSSKLVDGKVAYIELTTNQDGLIRIRNNQNMNGQFKLYKVTGDIEEIRYCEINGIIQFEGEKGVSYKLCNEIQYQAEQTTKLRDEEVYSHESATLYRHIFFGKDRDTDYVKTLESIVCNRYIGNKLQYEVSILKFDFGNKDEAKDYSETLHRQVYEGDNIGVDFTRIDHKDKFESSKGYGFLSENMLEVGSSTHKDVLRNSFIKGKEKERFIVELPKGKYDLFIVAGDFEEETYTQITVKEEIVLTPKRPLRKGEFLYQIVPIMLKEDMCLSFDIATKDQYTWRLNTIIINKIHQ